MSHAIAIVGGGPSGFYAVDGLSRALPGCRIDIIDRLPTPYGLVRFGVAPDHQGTKAVARQFERLAQKPGVRFVGNVEVGRDVSLEELRRLYDAVVIATGASVDRRLGIPGEDLPGVYGSWEFVGWYNGHPDCAARDIALPGSAVAVIGNGNVAIDLVRVLAKSAEEMKSSDLCAHAEAVIRAASLTDIHMIGRRGPADASFTPAELGELGHLARAVPVIEGADIPAASLAADPGVARIRDKNLEILRGFAANAAGARPIALHLRFNATPVAIEGGERVERLVLQQTGGSERWTIPVQTVITAIGYYSEGLGNLPMDARNGVVVNDAGVVEPGLYAVGWARRGPSGVIATNRADALAVVERIVAYLKDRAPTAEGPAALDRLLQETDATVVDFAGWQRIDKCEVEAGKAAGAPRRKLVSVADLLAAAR